MDWLIELFWGRTIAHELLVLSLVGAFGVLLGSIRIGGVGLGVAGVLFSGLLFGHIGFHVGEEVLEFVREFGLILFVYAIGVQVGPGFIASLRRQGLPLNVMAASVVGLGVAVTLAMVYLAGIDMTVAVGLFAGATTNTPALGAAQQALKDLPGVTEEMARHPGLAYAVAYPFGILGIILTMAILRRVFQVQPATEAGEFSRQVISSQARVGTQNLVVENTKLDGLRIEKIPGLATLGVVISRVGKGNDVVVATPQTVLKLGDVVLAVGPQDTLQVLQTIIGKPAEVDLRSLPSRVTTQRVVVTQKSVLGKSLQELNLDALRVAVTRISRAEIEFTPAPRFRFQFADTVLLVGEAEAINRAAGVLGNSPKQLDHPQIVPIFVGIVLGVLVGSWPWHLGSMPAPVKLGLAGGPLLVAIVLSRIGRLGPLIYYMPLSANFMLRELGITLFLACIGLRGGDQFVETLQQGAGLIWMGCGALITGVPLVVVGFAARAIWRMNFASICGVLAGSMTDPPALAYANALSASDASSVSYATVYPLTMLLRVLAAQLLVLGFVT